MQIKVSLFFTLLLVIACKSEPASKLVDLDLMSKGVPLKIQAPEGAVVTTDDMGVMKDITVKKGENYFIQILNSPALSTNRKKIIDEQKQIVKAGPFFSSILQEDEFGFIFEKKIDSTTINHDFRYVKIQGDQEYIFQTGLIGNYSVEDVKTMYQSVQ